jgi:hypothetical protein
MTVINQADATDEGKLLITGGGRRGEVQVELPGEATQMLIANIILNFCQTSQSGRRAARGRRC